MADINDNTGKGNPMTKGRLHPQSEKVDLRNWRLLAAEKAEALILEAASEAVQYVADNDGVDISFPVMWGPKSDGMDGPAVSDYLTVDITLQLSDDGIVFRSSLREAVDNLITSLIGGTGEFAPEEHDILIRVRKGFLELADSITTALEQARTLT